MKDEMSDEEFFVQAVPWLEGLLRRGMLCVATNWKDALRLPIARQNDR